jgi:hypothetical protein
MVKRNVRKKAAASVHARESAVDTKPAAEAEGQDAAPAAAAEGGDAKAEHDEVRAWHGA